MDFSLILQFFAQFVSSSFRLTLLNFLDSRPVAVIRLICIGCAIDYLVTALNPLTLKTFNFYQLEMRLTTAIHIFQWIQNHIFIFFSRYFCQLVFHSKLLYIVC